MSVDKLVDSNQLDSDLTSVANAIRTRGGTSSQLAFPSGFVSAVGAIGNTYSASDEGKVVDNGELVAQTSDTVTVNDTYDTTLINSLTVNVSGVGGYTLEEVMTGYPSGAVNYTPTGNVTQYSISGRNQMTSLTVNITGSIELEREAISHNKSLLSLTLNYPSDYTKAMVNYTATANGSMTNVTIKGTVMNLESNTLRGNSALKVCDISNTSSPTYGIAQNVFYGTVLDTLILRKTDGIVPLDSINAFTNGTKFRNGGGGGTLYVPNALIGSYQGATNWSTLLGYTGNVIAKIEGTTYETTYADGTSV